MSRFRKPILWFCDTVILGVVLAVLSFFTAGMTGSGSIIAGGFLRNILLLYACTMAFQFIFKTYDSLWRYAESQEYLMLLSAAICGFFLYEVVNRIFFTTRLPFAFLAGAAGLWVLGMLFLRFVYRIIRSRTVSKKGNCRTTPVAIFGAGSAGVRLSEELGHNPDSRYRVQYFFDDDPGKRGRNIHGIPVKGTIDEGIALLDGSGIHDAIIAIPSMSEDRRRQITTRLSKCADLHVSILPSTLELIAQKPIHAQLRSLQIDDLLGREPVHLDSAPADAFLGGKVIMVTGGGGSIGSELCRQIAKHHPRRLIIVDIYENNAYDIQQELQYHYGTKLDLAVEIASVRDNDRILQLFEKYRPEIVFHAAAHKHVPLMETSPQEAIRNNVFGTLNLARAADRFGVEKFILISTDKAVNPTSVMGASKRMCEMILQSTNGRSKTCFASVRFGNVLGSSGSVVPLFQRQIAAGGPITLTDKRIIRYFMTIPEAAQLVLQAGAMAHQNELFVLDMGQPEKILDLAEAMIRLSGLEPYRDINIVETGLRPGEKLYEEILIANRDIEKTQNDKIFVERQPPVTSEALAEKLDILRKALTQNEPGAIRAALHSVLPSFHEPSEVNASPQDAEVPRTAEAPEHSRDTAAGAETLFGQN